MQTLLEIAILILGLALLWLGRRHLEFGSLAATLLSVLELLSLAVATFALGWLGVGSVVLANAVGVLVWSVIQAIRKQALLTAGAVQGRDLTVGQLEQIYDSMATEGAFATLPPLKRAELIRDLATRARSPEEIWPMARTIAQLAVLFDGDVTWIAPRFDQLLCRTGHVAAESEEVAATLLATTQQAAASFEEILEAMIAVYDPGVGLAA
jgi:hypothetical protein